jgi:hypothetical protein
VRKPVLVAATMVLAGITYLGGIVSARRLQVQPQEAAALVSYADAKPILDRLKASLPAGLAAIPETELASTWPAWVSQLDRRIRARLDRGDEDSAINFLLFGTTFTSLPRALNDSAKVGGRERAADIVRGRIADLSAAIAAPDSDERLQFVRDLVRRHGIDPTTASGREQASLYFRTLMTRIVGEVDGYARTIQSARGNAELAARSTLFRTRGLSSDTSIRPDFAVDQALEALAARGTLSANSVRRIGVIGPGLDFTDKAEGHDFYPQQTTQPFSVIDSLLRLGLARAADVRLTTFDVNPRINLHLHAARQRALAGTGYVVILPRDRDDRWQPSLSAFWKSFGRRIGEDTRSARPPNGIDIRAVRVRPDIVTALDVRDVNVVVQRLVPSADEERFDLIVATNVLVYYDVFEQSLALANLAAMLRPGGVLLSNNVLVELPTTPLRAAGHSTAIYTDQADDRDDIIWYIRR